MQVIPNQSDDSEETRDCADDEAAIDQVEVFHVFVLLQEHLWEKQAAEPMASFPGIWEGVEGNNPSDTGKLSRRFVGN